jgi:ATP-dependent Lon protease
VLEIGGVKEKVLAAYRSGLREVILPKANEKDLRDVPPEVRQHMAFSFVDRMDQVLQLALLDPEGRRARPPRRRSGDGTSRETPSSGESLAADAP